MSTPELELVCPACGAEELCGPAQMLARLRSIGQLRREIQPDPQFTHELFRNSVEKFACHDCDHRGLQVREPSRDIWKTVQVCEQCRSRIPLERLELYPDAKRCAACESVAARSGAEGREFCGRCGEILQLKLRRGGGIARYEQVCPHCGR